MIELIERAHGFLDRIALVDASGSLTYRELLQKSAVVASQLLDGSADLNEARIGFIVNPSLDYTVLQWGIWRAGGIAVPLCVKHPYDSIRYTVEDAEISKVIYHLDFYSLIAPLKEDTAVELIAIDAIGDHQVPLPLPEIHMNRRAMILYTSGTTGKPKGVVTSHENINYQIQSLVSSWEWSKDDYILNVLPLHHVHGIINVMSCALYCGACNEFLSKFSESAIFERFKSGELSLFMAVPTIYYKLIHYYQDLRKEEQVEISTALNKFRLMVSGSAALPVKTLEQWRTISGHTLLERYGMTEMGMAISNPYRGERKPGYIGQALEGVTVRLTNESEQIVEEGMQGEIQIKGKNVFVGYYNRPEATAETFVNGWFKTGDIAVYENGSYRILGRNSVDIIKSGGYKISALEIEEVLRKHPAIKDCGVVGIPDEEWGELIGASLILSDTSVTIEQIKLWIKDKIAAYKLPRKFIIQDDLPRNVMGKVTKKELQKILAQS